MGSPLSPVLANIFMEYFESKLLPGLENRPPLWLRYVDDVFALWPRDLPLLPFLNNLNQLVPSIKFTVEWESEGSLPFLDTEVFRHTANFKFKVFRKPTHSGMFLHFYSWQPAHIKRGVLISMFLRAYRLCDPEFLNGEINYIKRSFKKLTYPDNFINKALSQARRKYHTPPLQHNDQELHAEDNNGQPKVISLPHTSVNHFIKPVFNAHDIRIVNKNTCTLRRSLVKTKPPNISVDAPGTYVTPCRDCP